MITYVDTSTVIKLIVDEEGSDRALSVWNAADAVASVRLLIVEARAALAAAERGGRLSTAEHAAAKQTLNSLVGSLQPEQRGCTSPTREKNRTRPLLHRRLACPPEGRVLAFASRLYRHETC